MSNQTPVADYDWRRPFYRFLIDSFIKDDGPVGDLARKARTDKEFPKWAIKASTIREYLEESGYDYDETEAFEEAYEMYQEDKYQLRKEDLGE